MKIYAVMLAKEASILRRDPSTTPLRYALRMTNYNGLTIPLTNFETNH